jgi:hypothetical protein
MTLFETIGPQNSYLRCYRVAHQDQASQLRNSGPIPGFAAIQRAGKQGEVIYLTREALPPDLAALLAAATSFKRFCQLVAFTRTTYQVTISERRLPKYPREHGQGRLTLVPGFCLTQPTMTVNLNDSSSMTELELRGFMRGFFPYAGQTVVVSLSSSDGKVLTVEQVAGVIESMAQFLTPPTPSVRSVLHRV